MILKENYIILSVMIAIWAALLIAAGSLTSGYHFADDHEIISFSQKLNKKTNSFISVVKTKIDIDLSIRFRPLYYFHRILLSRIFENNFFLWHIYNCVLAGITSFVLFLCAKNLGFKRAECGIIALLTFIGEQAEIWWRLGPNETIGMLMLALCLYYMSRAVSIPSEINYHAILFTIFAILSTLSKESFILCIPAIVFWYNELKRKNIGNHRMVTVAKNIRLTMFMLTVISIEIIFIIFFVGTEDVGYAGVGKMSIGLVLEAAKDLFFRNGLGVVLIIGLAISFIFSREYRSTFLKKLKMPVILLMLWILPQIALYAKTGMSSRYLLPAMLGLSIFGSYFVRNIRESEMHFTLSKRVRIAMSLVFGTSGVCFIGLCSILVFSTNPIPLEINSHIMGGLMLGMTFLYLSNYCLKHYREAFGIGVGSVLIIFIHIVLFFNLGVMYAEAKEYAIKGRHTTQFLNAVVNKTRSPDDQIWIAVDPAIHYEAANAINVYLNMIGHRNNLIYQKISSKSCYSEFDQHLIDSFDGFASSVGLRLVCDAPLAVQPRCICLLPGTETAFKRIGKNADVLKNYVKERYGPYTLYAMPYLQGFFQIPERSMPLHTDKTRYISFGIRDTSL